jgi:chitodextrinase
MVQVMDRRLIGALIIFAALVATLPIELGVSPGPAQALSPAAGTSSPGDPVIAAAGDIACDPTDSKFNGGAGKSDGCRQKYTADLIVGQGYSAVLALGDNQYYCGGYNAFLQSYDKSWGQLKALTYPAVGNHEYLTSGGTDCNSANAGAAGHFKYFGAAAGLPGQGYYSFDIGTWHLIMLNTTCSQAGGCGSTSPQGKWLRADLAAHTNVCTLAFWHIPLFSSGGRASSNSKSFWDALYAANADVVLTGHDHIYERFAPQTPSGAPDPLRGIREFVVGTGGSNWTSISSVKPNSEVRNDRSFGILRMTLHPTSYDWQFVPAAGSTFTDSGTTQCHGASSDTQAPSTPTNLQAEATGPASVALSWTASTDNVAVTGYRIQRDGAQVGSSTSTSFTDTTVAPGTSATYTVTAYDSGGNVSAASGPAPVTTPPDVTAPSVPGGLRTTDVGATSVSLAWDPSIDDVGVASYTVLRDGAPIGTPTTTSFVDTTAQPTTTYEYTVAATDTSGNTSDASAPLGVQTPAMPTTITVAPSDDAYVRSDSAGTNYGTATTIQVDQSPDKRTYLRFPVSGVNGRQVLSAQLLLNTADGGGGGEFHVVTDTAWTEGTLNWNNKPAYATGLAASLGAVTTGQQVTVDLTSTVTGDGTYSFAVLGTSSDGADYTSKEGGSLGPRLVLTVAGA